MKDSHLRRTSLFVFNDKHEVLGGLDDNGVHWPIIINRDISQFSYPYMELYNKLRTVFGIRHHVSIYELIACLPSISPDHGYRILNDLQAVREFKRDNIEETHSINSFFYTYLNNPSTDELYKIKMESSYGQLSKFRYRSFDLIRNLSNKDISVCANEIGEVMDLNLKVLSYLENTQYDVWTWSWISANAVTQHNCVEGY